ncbi:phosphonate transport system ATP-binding protein [Marinobacter persicus]|uniref:Phosphonate transport system ATP-binding protein n=1 Tax=Marinobacter persicus TaxID=930118 RepID=A0A1I3WAE0_9GAMM|nr:ATP-binding cassette domain-containing protein [Marinobacter persicus]GHD47100.1 phosphonates import ATP-binding protein PhnC [Marinobacter persicus]SFK03697.1 phosphonate transport system ATP-binding protein [Marinobacter persicus]
MPEIRFDGLTASFAGKQVVGPLSLHIRDGEHVALVGKSGAGKSTLIRLMYQHAEQQASLIPQDLGLVNALPVFHNVFMGQLHEHSLWYNTWTLLRPFKTDRKAIAALLGQLGMEEKQWTPAASLSGGQRQRVAIGRALYRQAPLLLADEPISALDGLLAHQVMEHLVEQFPTSVVALHDVDMALKYCDRIVGIKDGLVALDAPAAELTPADIMTLY